MLTRRFAWHGLESTAWLWFLLVALVAAVCITLLYQYERRLISRRLGLTLLGLRLAVVAAVFTTLLEPVLTWTINRERTGRVLVALDVSDSMSTTDRHATEVEKLQWLRALGMLGNAATDARLDRWAAALAAGREPEWVDEGETTSPDEHAELARSRQRQLHDLFATLDGLPRREVARRLLTAGPDALRQRLDKLALLEVQAFAGQATLITDDAALQEIVSTPETDLRPQSTDLLEGITPLATTSEETPLAGIVLLTDGRDNVGAQGGRLLARIDNLAVPVHSVLIGSEQRPRDLGISNLDYPEMVYQNDSAVLRASLLTAGFEGDEITVHLEREGEQSPAASRTVRVDGRQTEVQFDLDASELGRQRYVVRVEARPDETRDDNNLRRFSLNVVDDESRVLVLEGTAGWEFRFLDNALLRDEHVQVNKVVFEQPYLGVLPETFFPRTLVLPDPAEEQRESPFAGFDVVIVRDVAPQDLPSRTWDWLERFVREEGGTIVLTAGRNHFPLQYDSPVVNELLPVTDLRPVFVSPAQEIGAPLQRGIRLWLTPDGERQEMLQFDTDPAENRRIWDTLPGQTFVIRGTARPGATVFAALPDAQQGRGLEQERENAVIVHQYLGAGQVLWIGCDSTWRWRYRVGDEYHHRFWGQIVRWSAEFKAAAGNEHVRFGLERTEIQAGEEALIRARWNQRFLSQFPDLQATAEIRPVNASPDAPPVLTVDLLPTETQPLIYDGKASGLPPGDYSVTLKVADAELGADAIQAELTVTPTLTTELGELSANRRLLEQLADATGGRVFLPHQMHEIPALFQDVTEQSTTRQEISLWDHWLTLAVLFGLLATEWALRKLNGLP